VNFVGVERDKNKWLEKMTQFRMEYISRAVDSFCRFQVRETQQDWKG